MKEEGSFSISGSLCHQMGYLLSETASLMRERTVQAMESFNIPPRALHLLTVLESESGLTQQCLCKIARLDRASVVLLIDQLEKQGLVERAKHPSDRRCHILQITKKGRETHKKISAVTEKIQNEFLDPLPEKQRIELEKILIKLIQSHGAI